MPPDQPPSDPPPGSSPDRPPPDQAPPDQAPPDQAPPDQPTGPELFDLLTLGLTMAILVTGGLGLGWLVDDWLGTSPVATFVGLALGVTLAGLALWERARRYL